MSGFKQYNVKNAIENAKAKLEAERLSKERELEAIKLKEEKIKGSEKRIKELENGIEMQDALITDTQEKFRVATLEKDKAETQRKAAEQEHTTAFDLWAQAKKDLSALHDAQKLDSLRKKTSDSATSCQQAHHNIPTLIHNVKSTFQALTTAQNAYSQTLSKKQKLDIEISCLRNTFAREEFAVKEAVKNTHQLKLDIVTAKAQAKNIQSSEKLLAKEMQKIQDIQPRSKANAIKINQLELDRQAILTELEQVGTTLASEKEAYNMAQQALELAQNTDYKNLEIYDMACSERAKYTDSIIKANDALQKSEKLLGTAHEASRATMQHFAAKHSEFKTLSEKMAKFTEEKDEMAKELSSILEILAPENEDTQKATDINEEALPTTPTHNSEMKRLDSIDPNELHIVEDEEQVPITRTSSFADDVVPQSAKHTLNDDEDDMYMPKQHFKPNHTSALTGEDALHSNSDFE